MLKKISNKRNILALAATLLIVSMMAISCSAQGVNEPKDTDTISIHLGQIVAKAADDGTVVYDRTAFDDKTQKTAEWSTTVSAVEPSALYWSYQATKADSLYDSGKTTGFVALKEGKGLEATLENMSRGSWTFELRGYNTAADRTADQNVVYKGKTTTKNLTQNSQVDVPVTYAYGDSKSTDGAVDFDITVNYDQAVAGTANFDEYELEVRVNLGNLEGAVADKFTLTRDTGVTNTKAGYISKTYHYTSTSSVQETNDADGLIGDIMRDQGVYNDGIVEFWLVKRGEGGSIANEGQFSTAALSTQKAVVMSGLATKITATANIELGEGGKINIELYTDTTASEIGQPDEAKMSAADYQAASTDSGTALSN